MEWPTCIIYIAHKCSTSDEITPLQAAGKYRQQGRLYTVDDGDIIFFKFNAGAGLKDSKKKA